VSGYSVPSELRTATQAGTEFLRYLRPPDGRLPLLNDSVYGQALPLEDCLRYGTAVGFEAATPRWSPPVSVSEPETTSGYHWLRTDAGSMLVDGGIVGPPHLPGHSHSDTLSVLLWSDGRQVITDTGTFGYLAGSRREYARGVRGHNTVTVGTTEPIAIGGKYLMGPRPVPKTCFDSGRVTRFEGQYRARPYRGRPYTHHRSVYAADDWWLLSDVVDGHGDRTVRGRVHLHPNIEPSVDASGRIQLLEGNDEDLFVVPVGRTTTTVTTGPYFPQFGESEQRSVLEFSHERQTDSTQRLQVLFTRGDVDPASVNLTAGYDGPRLTVGDARYDLPETKLG
jgi:uncharacterized heparinase superfamily protein